MHVTSTCCAVLAIGAVALAQQAPSADIPREPMPPAHALVLPRGDKEVVIDGSLADWPALPAIRLDDARQLSGTAGNAWRGVRDLSAVAFLMWDEADLSFSCVAQDDWHRALDEGSRRLTEIPVADSIVLTFDIERDTRGIGPDPGRREDREFWLADQADRRVVQWDRLRGTARILEENAARVVVLHDKERGVTTYEAKLPWTEILPVGVRPSPGLVADLQIVLSDFDETTDPMPQTRIGWSFGTGKIVDPGVFGTIMLLDAAPADGAMPTFPAKEKGVDPRTTNDAFQRITASLLHHPPQPYDGTKSPEEAGGLARFAALEELDGHCARFPRVDYLEFHHRIHRRMGRELVGFQVAGLPWWWNQRLESLSKNAEDPVPNGTVRIFRLPMGGWLVRMPMGGFLVDAAGADVAQWLWGGASFCILSQPVDMTKRNDQLLVRMLQANPRRPVFTHIAFHLPVVPMSELPIFEPGQEFTPAGGVAVKALGKKLNDGAVTFSCSYVLSVPAGPRLMVVAPDLPADEADGTNIDAMILSPRNPEGLKIVQRVRPGLVLLDEAFLPQAYPDQPRTTLADLHTTQKALRPQPTLLLAPGESWDIAKAQPK